MAARSPAHPLPFFALAALFSLGACATADLNAAGAKVAMVRAPLGTECQPVGYLVGKGGGTFGGGLVSNEALIEYAMNDLRNKAGQKGATHVQVDPPQLGQGDGTTTTATVTGTSYKCPTSYTPPAGTLPAAAPAAPGAPAAPAAPGPAPAPAAPGAAPAVAPAAPGAAPAAAGAAPAAKVPGT
jgi:Domain of unknown function (DUF4156)